MISFLDTQYCTDMLNALAEQCSDYAVKAGFWEDEDILLAQLVPCDNGTVYERLWNRIIFLFNSEKIALEMSELAERLETLRNNPTKADEHCPDFLNIEIECADLIIRCLDFCGRRKLRIGEALIAKMQFNETRPFKHGKNF